jgi:hypothetical protein
MAISLSDGGLGAPTGRTGQTHGATNDDANNPSTHLDDLAVANAHLCSTSALLERIPSSESRLPSYSLLVLDEVAHYLNRAILALDEFSEIVWMTE